MVLVSVGIMMCPTDGLITNHESRALWIRRKASLTTYGIPSNVTFCVAMSQCFDCGDWVSTNSMGRDSFNSLTLLSLSTRYSSPAPAPEDTNSQWTPVIPIPPQTRPQIQQKSHPLHSLSKSASIAANPTTTSGS